MQIFLENFFPFALLIILAMMGIAGMAVLTLYLSGEDRKATKAREIILKQICEGDIIYMGFYNYVKIERNISIDDRI